MHIHKLLVIRILILVSFDFLEKKEQKPLAEDEHVDSEKKSDMGKKFCMYVYMSWQVFQ